MRHTTSRHNLSFWVLVLSIVCVGLADARAAVTHARREGFSIQVETTVSAKPEKVYRLLVENIGKWWQASHTYSGDANNLYLEAEPKGWFGERLPDGGCVQHMEVLYAAPGKQLRLRGALGPLQEHAVTGIMTWSLKPEGEGTALTLVYRVGGYMPQGLEAIARPVDGVVATQCARLKRFVETGQSE